MASNPSPETSLSIGKLQTLVTQLRQELSDKERQIADLESQLVQVRDPEQEADSGETELVRTVSQAPAPGSQEDLFARLDQFYQEE